MYCGKQLPENGVCDCKQSSDYRQSHTQKTPNMPVLSDNRKLYCILSYIGFLWLVGLFVNPERNDPEVKFHVGQGIVKSIATIGLFIALRIISAVLRSISAVGQSIFGFGILGNLHYYFSNGLNSVFSFIKFAVVIAFMIIGILNAVNRRNKPLPIIGKFAFYK